MTRCPSDLALERHLLVPDVALTSHLGTCLRCAGRLAGMRRAGETFQREVFPATVEAVVAAVPGRRFKPWLLAAPLAAAAAVALAVLVPGPRPPPGYVGAKGSDLGLRVYVGEAAGARAVAEGEDVPASAALRFQVRAPGACRLWLLSVDATGQVSRLFPTGGEGGAEVKGVAPLPGGAVLDGKPGPERLFAVCTPAPLPWAEVERSARALGTGAQAVRGAAALGGLPASATQATVLLEKRP